MDNSVYDGNFGLLVLSSHDTIIHIHGTDFKNNVGTRWGRGAVYAEGSSILAFSESCTLAYNSAAQGGAIYLDNYVQCIIAHGETVIIANNTASYYDGGGMFLHHGAKLILHSQSTLQILENSAVENGGGICTDKYSSISLAFNSSLHYNGLTSDSMIYFHRNQASQGGGLYLGLNSTVSTFTCLNNTIKYDKNSAEYGGAVYVYTVPPILRSHDQECFFQSLGNPVQKYDVTRKCSKQDQFPLQFSLNRVKYSGHSLFKESFDNCSVNRTSIGFREFTVLITLTDIQTTDVGSFQIQVYFCEMAIQITPNRYHSLTLKLEKN